MNAEALAVYKKKKEKKERVKGFEIGKDGSKNKNVEYFSKNLE